MKVLLDLTGLKESVERYSYAVLICIPNDDSKYQEMLAAADRIRTEIGSEVKIFAVYRRDASKVVWFIRPEPHPLICFFADGRLVKTVSGIRQYHGLLRELREVLKIDVREPVEA